MNLARPDGLPRGLRPLGLAHARLALRATKSPAAICRTGLVVCRRFELLPKSNGSRQALPEIFVRIARPDGFEPPTTWFEVRYAELPNDQQNPSLRITLLCHKLPTSMLASH